MANQANHIKYARELYAQGFSVICVKIYYKDRKRFVTPANCTELSYDECAKYIKKSWTCGDTVCDRTNAVMLLTGVRKGDHPYLKHCICIDVDNPKPDETDGREFINKYKKLFKNTYIETTGNGGEHYIFNLDIDESTKPIIGHTKHQHDGETYSIDILCNSGKVILAPSRYYKGEQLLEYKTDMSLIDDINTIPSKLYKMCRLTERNEKHIKEKKVKCRQEKVKYDVAELNYTEDTDKTIYIKRLYKFNAFQNLSYEEWFNIACAIKNEIPNSFDLFDMISEQNNEKYEGSDDCEKFFNGLRRNKESKLIKWGSLVQIAKAKLGDAKFKAFMKAYKEDLLTQRAELRYAIEETADEMNADDKEVKKLLLGPFTDVDISEYMFRLYGDEFKAHGDYIYYWIGAYWEKDMTAQSIHKKINVDFFKYLKNKADNLFGSDNSQLNEYQKVLKKMLKLRGNSSKKGVIEEFRMLVDIKEDVFDLNPNLLGFLNGVYDLSRMEFRDSRKNDYISLIINYEYKKSTDEEMNKLNKFINNIMPVEEERKFLLKALSSCLGGRTLENILILTGSGRNGKDTLLSYLMKEALGKELFYYNSNTVITGNNSSGVNQEKSNMDKKRCVLFSEPDKDRTLKNNTLKELSGGKQLNARGLYMKNTETILHATNIILCNKIPQLDNIDEAISQRLVVIPFRALFRKPEDIAKMPKDSQYVYEVNSYYKEDEFLKESRLPFINLLLNHYVDFKNDGYVLKGMPASIKSLSNAYMADSDNLLNWFDDTFEKTENEKDYIKMVDIYSMFRESDYYNNLSKKDKRGMNKKKLIDEIKDNPNLRMFYKQRVKINRVDIKQCITHYKIKERDEFDDSDDEY